MFFWFSKNADKIISEKNRQNKQNKIVNNNNNTLLKSYNLAVVRKKLNYINS